MVSDEMGDFMDHYRGALFDRPGVENLWTDVEAPGFVDRHGPLPGARLKGEKSPGQVGELVDGEQAGRRDLGGVSCGGHQSRPRAGAAPRRRECRPAELAGVEE